MKKFVSIIIAFAVICAVFYFTSVEKNSDENSESALNSAGQAGSAEDLYGLNETNENVVGIWFSYLDWNLLFQGKNQDEFTMQAQVVLENAASIGCNTIFLHVRAFGDAMYPSQYFPWSKSCTGEIGKGVDYDPLEIIISLAHAANIAVHAWINPMRTMSEEEFLQIDDSYIIKQWYNTHNYNYYMLSSDDKYILIPGNPEVRELISKGAAEIAENYDIDGIHMDDYFYPSNVDELEQNDVQYYQELNLDIPIEQWRRDSVTSMVKQIYQAVKSINSKIVVGVSPQSDVTNNYYNLYADVESWIGDDKTIDYIAPQIYFGFNNSSQPFDETAVQWNRLTENSKVELYIGLASYKIGLENDAHAGTGKTEWIEVFQSSNDMLKRQIEVVKSLSGCVGYCFYDYKSFFDVDGSVKASAQNELDNIIAMEQGEKI